MTPIIVALAGGALVLGIVELVRSRATDLNAWGLSLLAAAVVILVLG